MVVMPAMVRVLLSMTLSVVMSVVMSVVVTLFVPVMRMTMPLFVVIFACTHFERLSCCAPSPSRRPAAKANTAPQIAIAHTIIAPEGRSVNAEATRPST